MGLRWTVLAGILQGLVEGAPQVQRPSQGWHMAPEAVVRQYVRLSGYLLDRADEAHSLLADMRSSH